MLPHTHTSILILKRKHSEVGKSMLPHWKLSIFFEKKNKTTAKPNLWDLNTGLQCLIVFFLRKVPQCGQGHQGGMALVSIGHVHWYFRVKKCCIFKSFVWPLELPVSSPTKLKLFSLMFLQECNGRSPSCRMHLQQLWSWSAARWKAQVNGVVYGKKPEREDVSSFPDMVLYH